ncbi:hypothetical protein AQUSIP_02820 [Aquicella siphonis]|uniref:Abortive infection protein-like C-terminal domain-containing protein n=1 Tax=Aquicella siphonis TaxID=254247 RepID=A0A5E4PEU2_9COXI|nr:hypothetical protein [Aquicella siphonis]VVC75008.1 hypothetical protein AQUSIP_02820 [Aquicella siphonis]
MSEKLVFSKFYNTDQTKNEDKPKFRNRILKYLEDFVQIFYPAETNRLCRSELGITIKQENLGRHRNDIKYCVEETFSVSGISISDILDLITIVYDSILPHRDELSDVHKEKFENYINDINRILKEEAMCYVLNDDGRIRYYPDEEFYKSVKSTLALLNLPKYSDNLKLFNEVLGEIYKNPNKESPIHEFFKCLEIFTLSMNNEKKFTILNDSLIDTLLNKIKEKINSDSSYGNHDKEAAENIRGIFSKWVKMCHKYRHGKAEQVNNSVPPELFNLILSMGISIYRYLLEVDNKYSM